MRIREVAARTLAVLVVWGAFTLLPGRAGAQDLFELEVLGDEIAPPGGLDVELHTNAMSMGGIPAGSVSASHRPVHVSVEIARGWTSRLETAVFIQTAPFGPSGSARFAGGHARAQVRLAQIPSVPVRVAVSVEYAFNRATFDHELQTLEIRSILDYRAGRLSVVLNPSLEIVTRGSHGLEPVVDVSAQAAWRLAKRVSIAADYFSATATTRHLQSATQAHHLLFTGLSVESDSGWEVALSIGHCLLNREPWLMKSVVGYRF